MYSGGGGSGSGGGYGGYGGGYQSADEMVDDVARPAGGAGGDSISVTIRFRPLSEREYQRGDEVAWYADGDKLVRNEYNPATSYAFDKVFGEYSETQEVYDVAAGPVIRAAMEGINGMVDDVARPAGGAGGDSISVTIRFRPLSEREYQRGDEVAWYADGDKLVRNEYNPATSYAFDKVFGEYSETQEVYDVAAGPVIRAAMEGINGTVFAYGVTSSGKTHTMHTPGREFLLRVSYIEIYNEVINDLLDPTGQNLRVREDAQGTYVEGIKEEVVLSPGHALSFIAAGEGTTQSLSVCIYSPEMIESSSHGDEYDGVIFSQLNLIDLAGSESSKTETTGLRRKEGSYINKSLLTLGTVIGKLSEGRASHVPYRDSKLTRILQSSLSGHGHVSLICTITPASSSMEETHNTLKFASRAKRIEIYASQNKVCYDISF
nr:kinesin-like protein KIN-7D, mitochondrial [Tanacetum cinerariifolium]